MSTQAYTPTHAEQAQQQAERNMHLTTGQYKALALVCIVLGVWASWITWRFFVHGSASMEADDAVREISIAAASMFIVCEMCAFFLAKMLPAQRLYVLRWQLLAFAGAMLAFECFTIVLTQRGITKAADYHAQAVDSRTQQLEASIAAQRANAAALRDAGAHSAKSLFIASREQGAASVRQSLEVEERLAARADELAKVRAERKPTPTELLGEDGALYYAVARGLLVSLAGLVFFGAAGALLRAARTAEAGGRAGTGGVVGLPGVRFTAPGVVPQPANDGGFNLPPKTGTGYGKTWAWGAAALPLGLAAASFVPQPAQASQHTPAGFSQPAGKAAPPAAQSAPEATSASPAPTKASKPRTSTTQGLRMDTGTGARDGFRYRRVLAAVKAGKLRPSIQAIKQAEGGGTQTVRAYLAEMARSGIIEANPSGRGWRLKATA